MNSKRILTILILFALLMATSNAAFASSEFDDNSDINELELDEFDNQEDLAGENSDEDLEYIDEELDEELDEDFDDELDDEDSDSTDENFDDELDDEDSDSTDEDFDDELDDEDSDDEDLDEDSDDADEEMDDDYWDDFKWDSVEEWYENVDGKLVHIYKTTAFYKGKTYMASSCSYVPDNETKDNKTDYDTDYPGKCDMMLDGADSSEKDLQFNHPDLKGVSKSIDLSVSNDADSKNTSTDINENSSIPQSEYELGILGLLLVLIMSVVFII